MKGLKCILAGILFILGCSNTADQKEKSGKELAETYCGSCHLFPDPALLDKKTWKEDVLPPMARQLGIDHLYETILPNQKPAISVKEWKAILNYYINAAPAVMPAQERPVIKEQSDLFFAKKIEILKGNFPSTSFIKIDKGNHWIIAAAVSDSSVTVYNDRLKLISHSKVNAIVVDIDFSDSLSKAGKRNGVLTNIGIMNPNDLATGTANSVDFDVKGNLTHNFKIFDSIPRPVQVTKYDLDGDGREDYLVCGFGNTAGAFYWMRSNNNNGFEKKILSPLPGAIKAYIDDLNNDGLPDIVVLMAQAREGIFLYLNKGNGIFEPKELLSFPPVQGSSFFELVDFNNDGHKDLLYTCGDNEDYSSKVLKYYHGVYIYLNDGKNNFSRKYFFPIHGCYKAVARDFDKDGDLDIAAISFFPDTNNQPQESFVFLEQKSTWNFTPFTIAAFDEGRWVTMDTGDLDGDGYDDIVLGSLVPPIPDKIKEWKNSNRQKTTILFLHNEGKIFKNK